MTNDELNQYILHYLTEDKTQSAIMLTGDWGTGKSYYINNVLKPFLEKDENGKHQCIVVSLYGISETVEISKAIYFETRAKFLQTKTETGTAAKITARTIIKGVTSFFGVDLSASADNMRELYKSADLSGKLIVLEDLERSGLDILEVLGYVNNLVEQDGVKVLLIANEKELIITEVVTEKEANGKEKPVTVNTENTEQYLRTKEKTVSDTIKFTEDYISAIQQIITSFDNEILNRFANEKCAEEIYNLKSYYTDFNLRSFIFACQKTVDIYQKLTTDTIEDSDFIKTIFYGIIMFSQSSKCGKNAEWKNGNELSVELSSESYPLFRFCYDYIVSHYIDLSQISTAKEALKKLRKYSQNTSWDDHDLRVLYNWHIHTESEVTNAVNAITDKLKAGDGISFYEYGRLAVYLIIVKHLLDCDIEDAKKLLVKNLYNIGDMIEDDYLFTTVMDRDEKREVIEEYENLKSEMVASLNAKDTTIFDFDYRPSSIPDFCYNVRNDNGVILRNHAFASRLDTDKIVDMLKQCTSKEISDFRSVFLSVYQYSNIKEYLSGDKYSIENLLSRMGELESFEGFDKIQKKQIQFFEDNLKKILARL